MIIKGYSTCVGRHDVEIMLEDETGLVQPLQDILEENLNSELIKEDETLDFGKVKITIESLD